MDNMMKSGFDWLGDLIYSNINFGVSCGLSLIEHKIHLSNNKYTIGKEFRIARTIIKTKGINGFYRGITSITAALPLNSKLKELIKLDLDANWVIGYIGIQLFKHYVYSSINFSIDQNLQSIIMKSLFQALFICPINFISSYYTQTLVSSSLDYQTIPLPSEIFSSIYLFIKSHGFKRLYNGYLLVFIQLIIKNTTSIHQLGFHHIQHHHSLPPIYLNYH